MLNLKRNVLSMALASAVVMMAQAAYADAGATWWIESMWDAMAEHSPVTAAYDRLRQGPPT